VCTRKRRGSTKQAGSEKHQCRKKVAEKNI
jgi:hypothetical protein